MNQRLESAYGIFEHTNDVEDALEKIKAVFDIHHLVFHLGQISVGELDTPYIRTTYPADWVSRYLLKGYIGIDPVVQEGFARDLPFDWRELTPTPKAIEMMMDAANYDVGKSGYSFPVVDKTARRSLFSITSQRTGDEWDEFIKSNREQLMEVAFQIHRKALFELFGELDPMPILGPREIECLTWTARGKDYLAIAQILGISGHTARGYLKSARFKLECGTLPQAVAKAITLKLIKE